MVDQRHRAFHLARAQAEWIAASKAVSEVARLPHIRLATLHAQYAQSFEVVTPAADTFLISYRQGEGRSASDMYQPILTVRA